MVPRANVVARTAFAQARTTSTTAQALTSSSAQSGLAFGALISGLLAGAIGGAFFGIIGGIVGSLVFGLFGGILGMSAASICCAAKDLNGSIIRVKKVRVRSHYTLILHALPSPSHIDTHVHTPSPHAQSRRPRPSSEAMMNKTNVPKADLKKRDSSEDEEAAGPPEAKIYPEEIYTEPAYPVMANA